jgi:hypothetical protein
MALALVLVIGLERGLVGVQRDLGVDHQLLLARHMDDRIGPQPPVLGLHRVLEVEIGVLRQAALFEHVLQGPLAPAAARLGGVGERIAEPLRLALHLLLALAHPRSRRQAGQRHRRAWLPAKPQDKKFQSNLPISTAKGRRWRTTDDRSVSY